MKSGDKATYINPFEDEKGIEYTVLSVDESTNWCEIQANLGLAINPVYTANISDLTIIK